MPTIHDITLDFDTQLADAYSRREKKQIARMFLMHYLACDGAELILKQNEAVSAEIVTQIASDIKDLNSGKPVQYVLGFAHFYDLELKIDERALIPRPETEELVDWIIGLWKNRHPKILDVGTGSGCIPLALKEEMPGSVISGIDKYDAIDLAKENAELLELKVDFQKADALALEDYSSEKWDVIVSNPPYIPLQDKAEMAANVLEHEPETALFVADEDPLIFYREIGKYAINNLKEEGQLFFEIHEALGEEVTQLLQSIGFKNVEVREDLQGKDRMVKAER